MKNYSLYVKKRYLDQQGFIREGVITTRKGKTNKENSTEFCFTYDKKDESQVMRSFVTFCSKTFSDFLSEMWFVEEVNV